jgi:hypothetical protein
MSDGIHVASNDAFSLIHGPVDIFDEKQRGAYNQMIADSLDVTLSKKQRKQKRKNAARNLKKAVSKLMEDPGDQDAKATNDKQRREKVRIRLKRAEAKRKREAGDSKAIAAHAIQLEQYSTRYASKKVARLAGNPKACAAYAIELEKASIRNEATRQALHDKRTAVWVKTGKPSKSTEFGLGDESRGDEIGSRVNALMDSPAGSLCPNGKDTEKRWRKDHGEDTIREVLMTRLWAVYFLFTRTIPEGRDENKYAETTNFMTDQHRNPLWRREDFDDDKNPDLPRFTRKEVTSVGFSYKVDECVSQFDGTGIEGAMQKFIEEKLNMPHGICLHKEAGAGSRKEYSTTPNERKQLAKGEKCTNSVVMTIIGITNPVYADVDPSYPGRPPPLLSCTVTSHDGKNTHRVVVRGDKQGFPETKSVCKDNAAIAVRNAKTAERHRNNKRKADDMCDEPEETPVDADESDGGGSSDDDEEESPMSDGGSSDED